MTELSKLILEKYQVRKTKKQKKAFIDLMQENFPELKFENCSFGTNLILGDVYNAKYLFSAHYDTQPVLPFPNFLTPKNIFLYLLYQILILVPVFLIYPIIFFFTKDHQIAYLVTYLGLILFLIMLMFGKANKHTANDNTSGVITLIEIYSSLSDEEKKKCAFIFFDNEELGLLGSSSFRRTHKELIKTKFLMNFDCVSDGDFLLFVQNKNAKFAYENRLKEAFKNSENKTFLFESSSKAFYPSDQSGFPINCAVAAFNKSKILGLYIDKIHTNKDTVFDEKNITLLKEGTVEFIKNN